MAIHILYRFSCGYVDFCKVFKENKSTEDKRMDTKLIDFTSSELLFLSMLLKREMDDCNSKIKLILNFEDGLIKNDLLFHWMGQRDKASLWLTQVDTALINVTLQEQINNN